jgi:hypothetical protein
LTQKNGGQAKNEDKGGLGIGQKNKTAYNLGIITPEITSWSWLTLALSRVSNTGDGMELNDFDGLGAGRLRSSINDVGMNGKSTEKSFSTRNNGGQAEK